MPTHTIAENLQRLVDARTDIATAITAKGGTVNTGDGFEEFPADIDTIPTGTGLKLRTTNTDGLFVKNDAGSIFTKQTWNGLTSLFGDCIWTDGENIYYSYGLNHYVLDTSTSTWSTKTWSGLTRSYGYRIWTDGENIYFSEGTNQYVLDKSTSTWNTITWNGYSNAIYGDYIWTDGENIYHSSGSTNYVLDKSTSTWSTKTWSGLTDFDGKDVWTDGENIYSSSGSSQYVLNKSTSTWTTKTWSGLTSFYGANIWTDGNNIYYSSESTQYVLNKSTSTWTTKTWSGLTNFNGAYIWTDGENIYHSDGTNQWVLPISKSCRTVTTIDESAPVTRAIDFTNNTTTFSGDLSKSKVYNGINRCTVSNDGTVTSYYGESNYTENGSLGQVMVRIPKFYYKMTMFGTTTTISWTGGSTIYSDGNTWSISDTPRPGYKLHPAFINEAGNEIDCFYMSAFEASIYNSSTSTYYKNDDQVIGSGTAASNYQLASISGARPASGRSQNLSRGNSEIMAKNRGTGWHSCTFKQLSAIQMLLMVEFGANVQSTIANGVAFGSSPSSTDNCAVYTGSTTNNKTGRATSSKQYDGTTSTAANKTAVNWRGLENLWGNIFTQTIGLIVKGNGSQLGGIPYVCTDYSFTETSSGALPSTYANPGFAVSNTSGYIKYFGFSENNTDYDWMLLPALAQSSSGTAVNDYCYTTANNNANKGATVGGQWSSAAGAGLFYWILSDTVTNKSKGIGTRLSYVPQT